MFSTEEREEEQDEDMDTTEANESDNDEDAAEENSSDEVNALEKHRKVEFHNLSFERIFLNVVI